ncbi:hypothetical protein [Flavonifractor sp. An100]|uniref:hypothetical protein n=1 Tax=Flavonifractor sp. An100 TaxID=1965538 RepID=UPI000B368599|nr:hypothetical protein [Flavonifractor sp. An100]OUQ76894.1 hypothetical protein B5E43_11145 [Flavonifractor sp. An100]
MKWYVLTHIRKLFLVWVILGIVGLIVGLTLRPDLPNTLFLFYMIWVLAGHCGGNLFARSMLTQALRTLDETCDPEPLVEVSRAIVKQNPKVCGNWVYLAWALTLLGREEEALEAANRAERRPRRLWKNPLLLLIWSSALPVDDPRREKAEEALEAMTRRGPKKRRALIRLALDVRKRDSQVTEASQEQESALIAAVEQAGCTREQVSAHLALGLYYVQQGKPEQAQEYLAFVAAHGGKLKVKTEAEKLLCRLPAP